MAKNGKIPRSKSTDSDRETRVLLESMHSDIKRIAEGHSVLLKKLEEHDGKFAEMDGRFERIESVVLAINSDVKDIKNDVEDLSKKVDAGLANHDKRITKLEEKVLI